MDQGLADRNVTHSQKGLRCGNITFIAVLCKTVCNAGIDDARQLRRMNLSEMSMPCLLIDLEAIAQQHVCMRDEYVYKIGILILLV
jgi:hypothetical protein